jgi:RHS repeat-associated protein
LLSYANYQYLYDAFGRRLLKSLQGTPGLTVYQHDLAGHLLAEGALSSNTLQPRIDYLYLGERPVAMLSPATGALVFLHADRLDTPQVATAREQKMPWAAAYNPFGTIKPIVAYIPQNLRLPGQYADQETGYYHNGFRTYDPSLGRYLQSDPIGLKGGVNTYAYALLNPLANVDTLGLRIIPPADDPNGYYRQAIDYLLRDPDTVKTFRELASDPHGDWHIKFRDNDNYADPSRTIYWDPLSAIKDPCGHRISPALALLHEMEHALRFAYPDRHPITGPMGPDPQYDSPEERRVITGPEADAARKLGEDVRTSHHGDFYDVPGPTRR